MNRNFQVFEFAQRTAPALRCPKCSEDFDNRDAFRCHVATHTHPAMCPVCNLRLPSTTLIRAHNCSRFQCDGCQEEFVTLISLKKHITAIHGDVEYYCFECALPFVTQVCPYYFKEVFTCLFRTNNCDIYFNVTIEWLRQSSGVRCEGSHNSAEEIRKET